MIPLMPLPLIPIAIAIGTLLLGGASFTIFKKTDLFKKKELIRLAVLGLKFSGKTTLQISLRGTGDISTPLSGSKTEEVRIIQNGKVLIINQGLDVSGNNEAITHLYERQIKENDHIIFITDSSRLSDVNYLKDCRGLLNKINKIKEKEKEPKKLILIGSHRDQLTNKDSNEKFDDAYLLKKFDGLNEEISATFLVDLTSSKDLKQLKKSLFS